MSRALRYLVASLTIAALVVGTIVRFSGLGTFSFAADEYFLAQSVENILRFGAPAFECGGYYMRGLVHQYLAAGMRVSGFSPEFSVRAVSALSSLLALPAVYLLGRRTYGHVVGVLMIVLMAVSLWEVEFARFGRMYAPFQAVFLWYLVFFMRYAVDGSRNAVWGMVAISAASALVWEGGVFLALANFLPPLLNHYNGRLTRDQLRYLGFMSLLAVPIYWFVTHDFRSQSTVSALPPNFDELVAGSASVGSSSFKQLFSTLPGHPIWLGIAIVPLSVAFRALPWILAFRHRWLVTTGLAAILAAALLHQFLVVMFVVLLLLLFRLVRLSELIEKPIFLAAIISTALFWLVFSLVTSDWRPEELTNGVELAIALGYQFFGYPDFLDMIARQSARVIPILALSLFCLSGIAVLVQVYRDQKDNILATQNGMTYERALLVIGIVMLLLVSVSEPPRTATRYFFFVYPVLLLITIGTLRYAVIFFLRRENHVSEFVSIGIVLVWFASTEDFSVYHLRNIGSEEVNFRQHLPYKVRAHYIRRTDVQGVAEWLTANANPNTDVVISGSGINALDAYYPSLSFVFVDPSDSRLKDWSCNEGKIDRWSNLPLVYSVDTLRSRIAASPRSYMVVDNRRLESVWPDIADLNARLAWENPKGFEVIIQFESSGSVPID